MKNGKKKAFFMWVCMIVCVCTILPLASCGENLQVQNDEYKYIIGVSLPNVVEPWLSSIVEEITEEMKSFPEVNVIFKDAAKSSEQQIQDITQLMDYGIDLLIVSQEESKELKEAIASHQQKIPIIILGNDTNQDYYTSFIGYDDYKIGQMAGNYVREKYPKDKNNIVVLKGIESSVISENRVKGFKDAMEEGDNPVNITYLDGEWIRDKAEDRMKDYLVTNDKVDIVFALNDEMAYGAFVAAEKLRRKGADYIGVGGRNGKGGGITLVDEGKLEATIQCENMGSKALKTAVSILNGEKVPLRIILSTELYTGKEF